MMCHLIVVQVIHVSVVYHSLLITYIAGSFNTGRRYRKIERRFCRHPEAMRSHAFLPAVAFAAMQKKKPHADACGFPGRIV
jgi:hypothetical protein